MNLETDNEVSMRNCQRALFEGNAGTSQTVTPTATTRTELQKQIVALC